MFRISVFFLSNIDTLCSDCNAHHEESELVILPVFSFVASHYLVGTSMQIGVERMYTDGCH